MRSQFQESWIKSIDKWQMKKWQMKIKYEMKSIKWSAAENLI